MDVVARDGSEGSSNIYPVDNMPIQGGHFPSQWTPPASRSSECSSSNLNGGLPHYQTVAPAPSLDPFPHQPPAGNPHMHQDNYSHHPSSSSMGGQTVHGVDSGFYDQTVVSGRGPYKRKISGVAPTCEIGSTSRYHDAGSSSNIHLPVDPWQEKQSAESYHTNLEYPPSYGVHTIASGSEGTSRNIRSRADVSPETNLAGNHLSNPVHHPSSSWSSNQPNSSDFWGPCFNVPMRDWNRNHIPPPAIGPTFGSS